MARVELAVGAVEDLGGLIATLSLPGDTRARFRQSLLPLERFPRMGPELTGRWSGLRFLLGPWRWMLLVYRFTEEDDRVVVVTVQDARSSSSASGHR